MLRRKKRHLLLVFGTGSIIFIIQSAFQSLTLMPTDFEVEFGDTKGPRIDDGIPTLDSRDASGQYVDIQDSSSMPTRTNTSSYVVVSEEGRKKAIQAKPVSKPGSSHEHHPLRITKFENKTRAAEFNVNVSRLDRNKSHFENDNTCVRKAMTPISVRRNSTQIEMPFWQRKLIYCRKLGYSSEDGNPGYFLAELLQVRIYKEDSAKWSIKELKQWIHFMFLAGVDHIFLCDHYKNESERLDKALEKYINLGLVSYFDWSHIDEAIEAQVKCYEHIIGRNAYRTMWTIAVDMDEYPISPTDKDEDFLVRYLKNKMSEVGPRLSEISIPNFLMLGEGDNRKDLLSSRINRITHEEYGEFVKPIFRPKRGLIGIHRNDLLFGKHIKAQDQELRMLHYWGKRLQNWGPDTEHMLAMTEETDFMTTNWVEKIRNSLLVFDELDAFDSTSGP